MRRMALAREKSRSKRSSENENMSEQDMNTRYVVCVQNEGYPASLELLKIYRALLDDRAAKHQLIRVIDESGEDYLYPVDFFVPIELPQAVEKVFSAAGAG